MRTSLPRHLGGHGGVSSGNLEVQFGKYSFVAYDLFVKHLDFYVGDKIDVGIEILPMKSLQSGFQPLAALTPRLSIAFRGNFPLDGVLE